ncbi:MAG: methylenetetrahydrofolate--tRNA-(uracil(54)-C(5))-methyltransferase (FADH(2)-oxidizing) TrmFO [Candidatus Latescibacterota bacterium]|nr:MAG: methylenetetrahydrofolate--tRNA-(uracil(54)-C(5))-methyltransferase (FADH(2)-oxidizing) TrmFO [Candidatus Latescibacterota bacterium]
MKPVHVIGGGLSGCEAALQLADRGVDVCLREMRPVETTAAHRTGDLAEIVCSNSFKSVLLQTASGLLKEELNLLSCRLLDIAKECAVPAGHALAVDRELFAGAVTGVVENHPRIVVERRRQDDLDIPRPAIICTGPLTAKRLSATLAAHCTQAHLYFYDAIAPSVDAASVDTDVVYRGSRYGKGEADYLNIPLSRDDYRGLLDRIRNADTVSPHPFEEERYFESCLPIEVLAARGEDTARFGPLRPKGLPDPRTGSEPYAVIQLRQESISGDLLGLVGFQTRMTYKAQSELIRSIPGLHDAKILRFGSIHRNMFLNLPAICRPYQQDNRLDGVYYAGQICGVEGYVECIASGLVAALAVFCRRSRRTIPDIPPVTMIGALMNHIHTPPVSGTFQPMNANMGILPARTGFKGGRRERYQRAAERSIAAMKNYRDNALWLFENVAS